MADSTHTLVHIPLMMYYALFFFVESALLFLASLMRSRSLSILAAMVAITFCGLRFETGYDYNSYRSFFEEIWIYEGLLEPGFYYFVHFANTVGASSFVLFFLFALLTHGFAYYTLGQMSNSPNLAFLIYLLIPGLYLNSFSILRSAFAVIIFAYAAFRLISGKSKLEYLAWAMLATSFHYTAAAPFFIAFVIFLGPRGLPSRSICMLLLTSCLIASQLPLAQTVLGIFAGTKFESYAEMNIPQGGLKILASNLLAIFIIYRSRYFEYSQVFTYFFKVWLVGSLLLNVFIEFSPVTRISYYFGFLSIPLMIHAASVHGGLVRLLSQLALIIFFSAGFIAALYNDTLAVDEFNMSNYKTIFEAP
jgi:transmembrane protein EpsG